MSSVHTFHSQITFQGFCARSRFLTRKMKLLVVLALACVAQAEEEKRSIFGGLSQAAGRLIAGAGDVFLPEDLMKAGCKEVGLTNEPRGKRSIFGGLSQAAGRLIAGAGDVFLPEDLMKAGCKEVGLMNEPAPAPPVQYPQFAAPAPIIVYDPPVPTQYNPYG